MLSDILYFLSVFIFEEIIFPNATSKKINPIVRLLCVFIIFVVIFGTMALCFLVGINLLLEDFKKNIVVGFMLNIFGLGLIWYFIHNLKKAKNKQHEMKLK